MLFSSLGDGKTGKWVLAAGIFAAFALALLWSARAGGVTGSGIIEESRINLSFPQLRIASASATPGDAPLGRVTLFVDSGEYVKRGQKLAAVDNRAYSLERTTLRAPHAGRVTGLTTVTGELVYPNQTLIELGTGRFDLKLYLDPAAAARIGAGMRARVFVDSYPNRPLEARVSRLVPTVEPAPTNLATEVTRLFDVQPVILRVTDRDGTLKAGLPADAIIQ